MQKRRVEAVNCQREAIFAPVELVADVLNKQTVRPHDELKFGVISLFSRLWSNHFNNGISSELFYSRIRDVLKCACDRFSSAFNQLKSC